MVEALNPDCVKLVCRQCRKSFDMRKGQFAFVIAFVQRVSAATPERALEVAERNALCAECHDRKC